MRCRPLFAQELRSNVNGNTDMLKKVLANQERAELMLQKMFKRMERGERAGGSVQFLDSSTDTTAVRAAPAPLPIEVQRESSGGDTVEEIHRESRGSW